MLIDMIIFHANGKRLQLAHENEEFFIFKIKVHTFPIAFLLEAGAISRGRFILETKINFKTLDEGNGLG